MSSLINHAIEIYAKGFSFTRSMPYPYVPKKIGGLWVLRDAPRKNGRYRNEEWIAFELPASKVDGIIKKKTTGNYNLCVVLAAEMPDDVLRSEYKSLGYRLMTTQALMVHNLLDIPHLSAPVTVRRVDEGKLVASLAKEKGKKPLKEEYWGANSQLREYVAFNEGEPIGWGTSIAIDDAAWCAEMYVKPQFRCRGIGRVLLNQMLREDKTLGAKMSVLLATHGGEKLYSCLGYKTIGTLYQYSSVKRGN